MARRRLALGYGTTLLAALLILVLTLATGCVSSTAPPPKSGQTAGPATTPGASSTPPAAQVAPTPVQAPESVSLKWGHTALGTPDLPLLMAKRLGLLEKGGLKLVDFTGSDTNALMQALVAGEVEIFGAGFDTVLGAAAQGATVKWIAERLDGLPYFIVTPSNIRSYADLKGKRIAGGGAGTLVDNMLVAALVKRGKLNPKTDVEYANYAVAARMPALLSGQAAATVLAPPQVQDAQKRGFRILDEVTDALGEHAGMGYISEARIISRQGEAMRRFLKIFFEGVAAARANSSEAITALQTELKLDAETAADVYKMVMPHFRSDGRWVDVRLQNTIDYFMTNDPKKRNPGSVPSLVDASLLPVR